MTVILLSCSYDDREFVRVGYYVNNEYMDQSMNEEPPAKPDMDKIRRNILADKPRVTRFQIKWDSDESAPSEFPPEQPDVDNQEDDEAQYGAEEVEEEEAELAEVAEGEELATAKPAGEDADMEGVETNGKDDDEESNAGSEDLEAESDGEDEEEEEEGEEGEGDDMEMDEAPAENGKHQRKANSGDNLLISLYRREQRHRQAPSCSAPAPAGTGRHGALGGIIADTSGQRSLIAN